MINGKRIKKLKRKRNLQRNNPVSCRRYTPADYVARACGLMKHSASKAATQGLVPRRGEGHINRTAGDPRRGEGHINRTAGDPRVHPLPHPVSKAISTE